MQSEVRKVLESMRGNGWNLYWFWSEIDAAEHADAAKRDEPAQALRKAVAELVARWENKRQSESCWTSTIIRQVLGELETVIATKPDTVENRQATASGPAHDVTFGASPKMTLPELITKAQDADQWREIKPVIEPAVAEKMREIATRAVRDAMPDVLETVADAMKYDCGFDDTVDMIYMYAARLRKERGV